MKAAQRLFESWRSEYPNEAIRLLGVGASQLNAAAQGDLFAAEIVKNSRQDAAVDQIRERFGTKGIMRGGALANDTKARPRRA